MELAFDAEKTFYIFRISKFSRTFLFSRRLYRSFLYLESCFTHESSYKQQIYSRFYLLSKCCDLQ